MPYRIQLRHDDAATWTSADPTLFEGEVGIETDTGKIKIGDGTTAWTSLPYFGGAPSGTAGGDLSGSYPNPTVDGLQGRAVASTAPTDGQALVWDNALSTWKPASVSGSGGVTSLTGTPNEVTVSASTGAVTVGLPDEVTVVDLNTEKIDYDTTPTTPTDAVGRQYWDANWETLSLGLDTNVNLKHGQQLYVLAHNSTGTQIDKGKVVCVTGSHASTHLLIELADADLEAKSATTIGIAAENIAHGATGYVQIYGHMSGLTTNNSNYPTTEGDPFYLSDTAGSTTPTIPTQPKHGVRLGFLVKRAGSPDGSIFISIQNYQELEELSDVLISGKAEKDLLSWDNTAGVWKNRTIANAGVAAASHTHAASDVTSGTFDIARIPTGTSGTTVSLGNHTHAISDVTNLQTTLDGKASSTHVHGNITNAGKIGSFGQLVVVTSTDGTVTVLADGASNQFLKTDGAGTLSWGSGGSGSFTISVSEHYNDTDVGGGSSNTTSWTKPTGAKLVFVECIGGGAGGANGTTITGGVGGGAGSYVAQWFDASVFDSTEDVVLGAGGTGGAANSLGGETQFGNPVALSAYGGRGSSSAEQFVGSRNQVQYGGGGTSAGAGRHGGKGSGGGGGGSSSTTGAGSAGGAGYSFELATSAPQTGGGSAGGAIGTAGTNGTAVTNGFGRGHGAGGGGGSTTAGGNGGIGIRGSGGGGGGAGTTTPGTGGKGGTGYIRVTSICYS